MRGYLDQTLVVVLLGLGLTLPMGCGGPASSPQNTESSNQSPNEEAKLTGPAATVHAFLEGARRGDNEVCASMLTNLARTKMAEAQLPFAPPASDTARFELGEVQIPNDQLARVACRWIETDPTTKQTQAQDATYLLRNEAEGWRIAGVARVVLENEPPLLLNYEDPEDMVRQAEMLQAEIARRAQAAGSPAPAQSPEAPSQR
ncbi:MAG: hypothetical protein JW719_04960 [Pirellulales bacterium]|nr:hypothetical protein [Pirellulales bacterium]